jgi:hypothetical protein
MKKSRHCSSCRGKSRLTVDNPMWKGEKVGYEALHDWIKRRMKKPKRCQSCKKPKPLDLANISDEYKRDISDWEWLCRLCHMKKDGRLDALLSAYHPPVERTKNVDGECDFCHKGFKSFWKNGHKRFCCRKCQGKANYRKTRGLPEDLEPPNPYDSSKIRIKRGYAYVAECAHCHAKIMRNVKMRNGRMNRTKRKFCSTKCGGRAYDRRILGLPEDHPLQNRRLTV